MPLRFNDDQIMSFELGLYNGLQGEAKCNEVTIFKRVRECADTDSILAEYAQSRGYLFITNSAHKYANS
jgi:hypothetical protein